MTKKIDVSQAEIKTATIEVKVLQVNKRKMTLSVFRQIKEEELINTDTQQLQGVPWGLVNYFWGYDKDFVGLHVLWQKAGELRRSLIPKRWRRGRHNFATDMLGRVDLLKDEAQQRLEEHKNVYTNEAYRDFSLQGDRLQVPEDLTWDHTTQLRRWGFRIDGGPGDMPTIPPEGIDFNQIRQDLENDARARLERREERDKIIKELSEANALCYKVRQEYENLYETLALLDHLFIAV